MRAVIPDDFYVHESVNYQMTLAERVLTQINSTWSTVYFHEPMLSARWMPLAARLLRNGQLMMKQRLATVKRAMDHGT
ncbi:MAG: hypothetical protein ACREU6_09870 [Steroidobacteraceae bacterium]